MNEISRAIEHISPDYVIIDSIQTMTQPDITSVAGSVSQVRETTAELLKIAKTNGIAILSSVMLPKKARSPAQEC